MIIAKVKPEESTELNFDLNISGSNDEPSEFRFVIEAKEDSEVKDAFSIICRAERSDNGVKVVIPRLLNLFEAGSHKARLEVVLESRLFVPLKEEIWIEDPVVVEAVSLDVPKQEPISNVEPNVSISISNPILMSALSQEPKEEDIVEDVVVEDVVVEDQVVVEETPKPKNPSSSPPIDTSWKEHGFKGFKNPFKT